MDDEDIYLPAIRKESVPRVTSAIDEEEDFLATHDNLQEITELGQEALRELAELARASQSVKAYESLSLLMERVSNVNKTFYNLHKDKKELKRADQPVQGEGQFEGGHHIHNHNNLHLTTEQMNQYLEQKKLEAQKAEDQ